MVLLKTCCFLWIVLAGLIVSGHGHKLKSAKRIIGGNIANAAQFPYSVLIYNRQINKEVYKCGGTVLSPMHVLTAAHCGNNVYQMKLYYGVTNRHNPDEPGRQVRNAVKIMIDARYNNQTLDNDIAVVTVDKPVEYTKNIQPVPIVRSSPNPRRFINANATAIGFGQSNQCAKGDTGILKFVDVTVITNKECSEFYKSLEPTQICAKRMYEGPGMKNSNKVKTVFEDAVERDAKGDDGGPLMFRGIQIGITSFRREQGCKMIAPTVFTKLDSYLTWLHNSTGLLFP